MAKWYNPLTWFSSDSTSSESVVTEPVSLSVDTSKTIDEDIFLNSSGVEPLDTDLINERTKNSKKCYLGKASNGGDKYSIDSYIGAIHYKNNPLDNMELWKNINTNLVESIAPWDWEMVESGYHVHLLEDFTSGQIIEFEKRGEYVRFQPMALQYSNDLGQLQSISMPETPSSVVIDNNTIHWLGGYGVGKDFSWTCGNTRLLKLLTIDQFSRLPAIQQYIIDGGNPVIELNLIFDPSSGIDAYIDGQKWDRKTKKSTFGIIEWKKDGETLFGFMPNWYWDSSGNPPETSALTTIRKSGGSLYVTIRIPYSWIESAVYPIYIDTVVDEDVGASTDDCFFRYSDSLISNTSADFWIGDYNGTAKGYGVSCRFQINDNLAGVTIENGCYLSFYATTSRLVTTCNARVTAEDVASAAAYSNVWATEIARYNAHTTAVVDWDNIESWVDSSWYNSGEIKPIIQELVNSGYGYSGNYMGFYVQDFDYRSDTGAVRKGVTNDGGFSPKLHIEYTAGVGETTSVPWYTWFINNIWRRNR